MSDIWNVSDISIISNVSYIPNVSNTSTYRTYCTTHTRYQRGKTHQAHRTHRRVSCLLITRCLGNAGMVNAWRKIPRESTRTVEPAHSQKAGGSGVGGGRFTSKYIFSHPSDIGVLVSIWISIWISQSALSLSSHVQTKITYMNIKIFFNVDRHGPGVALYPLACLVTLSLCCTETYIVPW